MHIVQLEVMTSMVMGWIWTILLLISIVSSFYMGTGSVLATAALNGAQSGFMLALSIAGAILLWTGVGNLMDKAGLTGVLSKLLRPILIRLFPDTKRDKTLANYLSANICANFLGLGNAATPMGIQAAKRMADPHRPGLATDQLCRLIVLNTASIQLIPANVAAIRASQGCSAPFDILPAVWITSLCSAGLGLLSAWLLGKVWRHG